MPEQQKQNNQRIMNTTSQLVDTITKGIQEKKGQDITLIDLSTTEGAITSCFVVCQGGSPSQVDAIATSVEDFVRKNMGEKPVRVIGLETCQWVAMDFTDVMVHIFLPETRRYYDLENLWQDAEQTVIPNIE